MPATYAAYEPLDVPRRVVDGLWTVDGPCIDYRVGPVTLPCPTRMTVIETSRGLLLHSPTRPSEALVEALAGLGRIAFLVAPNSFHTTHIADWKDRVPEAAVFHAPRLPRGAVMPEGALDLGRLPPPGLPEELDIVVVDAKAWAEAAFFHRPSRTLVLTDLVQVFEPARITGRLAAFMLRVGGATGNPPQASLDMRLQAALAGGRAGAGKAFARIRGWQPERLLIAHGAQPEGDPAALLERGFAWA